MDDDSAGRVATVGSYIGGVVCAIGWYVFMAISLLPGQEKTKGKYLWDCHANVTALPEDSYVSPCEFTSGAYWAPGILMTLGVVMLNVIRWTALGDDMSLGDDSSATKAKIWVVVCFVIMFCALGGGVWITVVDGQRPKDDKVWMGPGIAVLVQCICLFVGGLIFRIARRKEDHAI